jgi:hypothetical protein
MIAMYMGDETPAQLVQRQRGAHHLVLRGFTAIHQIPAFA